MSCWRSPHSLGRFGVWSSTSKYSREYTQQCTFNIQACSIDILNSAWNINSCEHDRLNAARADSCRLDRCRMSIAYILAMWRLCGCQSFWREITASQLHYASRFDDLLSLSCSHFLLGFLSWLLRSEEEFQDPDHCFSLLILELRLSQRRIVASEIHHQGMYDAAQCRACSCDRTGSDGSLIPPILGLECHG
jgi:hypothetical protein